MVELPVELWAMVFRKLRDKDLVVLCQTCALFHTLAQSQLYETVRLEDFSFPVELPGFGARAQRTMMFNESVKENPSLAILVRTLDFTMRGGRSMSRRCENNTVFTNLHWFFNLQSLTLVYIIINSNMCSAIQALPHLKSVKLKTCDIDHVPMEKPIGTIPAQLLDIDLFDPPSGGAWTGLFPSGFKSFSIGLTSGISNCFVEDALTHVTSAGLTMSLTTLVFTNVIIPGTSIRFLETLSQLQHIFLPVARPGSESDLLRSLSSSAMPVLETFSGPAELCDVFLRGRPVHTVEMIVPPGAPHNILHVLRLSSVDVRDLRLTFDAKTERPTPTMDVLLQHAPETIQRLAWNALSKPLPNMVRPLGWSPVGKACLLSCVPFLGRFPCLHTLRGSVIDPLEAIEDPEGYEKNIDPAGQQELVRACADASASLRLFILKEKERDVKWVKWDDGTWEYYTVE